MSTLPVEYGRCPTCGDLTLPIVPLLPCGHDGPPQRAPLEDVGHVYAWTRVFPDPDHPTVIAMVDFFDGRLRVASPVADLEAVSVGDRLRAVRGRDTPIAFVTA